MVGYAVYYKSQEEYAGFKLVKGEAMNRNRFVVLCLSALAAGGVLQGMDVPSEKGQQLILAAGNGDLSVVKRLN